MLKYIISMDRFLKVPFKWIFQTSDITVFIPLAAQAAYQSHFRWALIKTLLKLGNMTCIFQNFKAAICHNFDEKETILSG